VTGALKPFEVMAARNIGDLDSLEGCGRLVRHVIVSRTSEVIELSDSRAIEAEPSSERATAFLRLADEHLDAAYRLARAILRDPIEAQDATHDAFVQAWRRWSTLRDASRFEPWFDRILVNICRDRMRRTSRWQTTDISSEVALATGDPLAQTDERDVLETALATLSPDHQVVVALRYFRDLPVDAIASRLGIPSGTVQSRLHYALKRLHAVLDAQGTEGTVR
jgi:RNA polymerase sigma-70 factor (ECF subfamily)